MGPRALLGAVVIFSLLSSGAGLDLSRFLNAFSSPSQPAEEDFRAYLRAVLERKREVGSFPSPLIPLVIIPPLTGTQLYAKLDGKKTQHLFCARHSDWFLLFSPDLEQLVPPLDECWAESMSLEYNNGTLSNFTGVEVKLPAFGGIDGIEYIDANQQKGVWDWVVSTLVALGYEVGLNIRGAPYDWRLGPTAWRTGLFPALQQLFEETYVANNNTAAAAVSMSMGGPVFLLFLSEMEQAWKDKYIQSYTSFSGAFGGSTIALMESVGLYTPLTTDKLLLQTLARSLGAVPWLMPFGSLYGDTPFAITPTRKYTPADFHQLYLDSGATTTAEMYADALPYQTIAAPGVPITCVFGYNVTTAFNVTFVTKDFDGNFTTGVSDGDGTVPIDGLRLCDTWAKQQSQPAVSYPIINMPHGAEVHLPEAIDVLLRNMKLLS